MTTTRLRPMKGEPLQGLPDFPCWIFPKIDGYRGWARDGKMLSSALNVLPNKHLQSIASALPTGLDMEITVGPPNCPDTYDRTKVGCTTEEGEYDFQFWIIDRWDTPDDGFDARHASLHSMIEDLPIDVRERCTVLRPILINSVEELDHEEARIVGLGFEGIIGRRYSAKYKYGKSTAAQGDMWKLKRFEDAEATIIGFNELLRNTNEATLDERGLTKRSHKKAGKVPAGVLGNIIVRCPDGVEFEIGTGFKAAQRVELWAIRDQLIGQIVTYKWFPHGTKDRPRHGVFRRFRDPIDMTDY